MCPIEFNPAIKTAEIQSKEPVQKSALALDNTTRSTGSTPLEDKFVKSELLSRIENLSNRAPVNSVSAERITELKEKISHKDLAILSDNPSERFEAAKNVARKLIAFEQQLQFKTTTADE